MTEKVLSYPRGAAGEYDGVTQTRPWDCGPASAQIILKAAGIAKTEQWLIDQIGTTVDGTNSAELIVPVLNSLLPGSGYRATWLSREPVSAAQINQLWSDASRSIAANRGVVLNFEAPPGRGPKGSRGSTSPPYPLYSTTYHYTAGMGTAQDADGSRHIWVADPAGFGGITGYWCPVEDIARLIVPHAYAFAADAPIVVPPTPAPSSAPTDRLDRLWIEWNAIEFGDVDSISVIVASAKAGDARSAKALAKLEQSNPAALQQFITSKRLTMTPKFRQILYVIGVVAFTGLTLLSTFHILDPNVAANVSAALTTFLGLFGVTVSGVAGYHVSQQVRTAGSTPADQVIAGVDAVVAQAQHAQSEVDRVKTALGQAVQDVPVLGPLAQQALDALP